MKKLPNMVIIEETIGDGFLNEKGKAVVTTKTKTYARSKDWYEKNKSDETLKVLGDAYEVIRVIQGRKVRQVVTIEKAEELESGITPNILIEKVDSKESIQIEEEIDSESEEESEEEETIEEVEIVEEIQKEEEGTIEAEKEIQPKKRGPKKKEEKEN